MNRMKIPTLILISMSVLIVGVILLSASVNDSGKKTQLVTLQSNTEDLKRLYLQEPLRDDERIQLTASLQYIQIHIANKPLYDEVHTYSKLLNAYIANKGGGADTIDPSMYNDVHHGYTMFQSKVYAAFHADEEQTYYMEDSERYNHMNDVIRELKNVNWGIVLEKDNAIETFASMELLSKLLTQEKLDDSQLQRLSIAISDEMSCWLSQDITDEAKKSCQWTMKSYLYEIASRIELTD